MELNLIFKAVVGSQAYGLATPTSDVDVKGVFMQPNKDLLVNNKYIPFIEVNKDECYYELRHFLTLLASGNPTAIELLFTPYEQVIETSDAFEYLKGYSSFFLTKKLYDSFGGYAGTQLQKAKGLDKKFNWEKSRIERKYILDFCKIIPFGSGKTLDLKEYLEDRGYAQENMGLTKVDGFRDTYKLYPPLPNYQLRGIMKEGSNDIRVSEIPKEHSQDWLGIVYFNKEAYATHCRDYKSYREWLNKRNEIRYKESREGKQYDSKNMMHTTRLILTIEEFHKTGIFSIDMSHHRDYLLDIKLGNMVSLEDLHKELEERVERLNSLKLDSYLPDSIEESIVQQLEYKLRKAVCIS